MDAAEANAQRLSRKMQREVLRFAEADGDGSGALDWDEFLEMQPSRVRARHSDDEIRTWFEQADVDGKGTVSIDEFFVWTLQQQRAGATEGMRSAA